MDPSQRQIYEDKAKHDRERYLEEVQAIPPDAKFKLPKLKKRRRHKDKTIPKRVLSPYVMFVRSERPQLLKLDSSASFNDIMRTLGQKWRAMSSEEKEPFVRMSESDKVRFREE
jgi:hypothetical protein